MIFLQKLLHHSCFHITLGITLFLFSLNTNHCMIILKEREREETVTLFLFTYFVIHQDTLACIFLIPSLFRIFQMCDEIA